MVYKSSYYSLVEIDDAALSHSIFLIRKHNRPDHLRWAKPVGKHQDARLPMLTGMLQQLIRLPPMVCSFPFESTLYKAAFLITFF